MGGPIRGVVLAGGLFGALLLVVAEFTTLYTVRTAASSSPIRSVSTHSHDAFALIPIAVLVAVLAFGTFRDRSRAALLAIGLLGVIALLIALIGDLPDAHKSGFVGSAATHYVTASTKASAGLYMETLGAVVLIITCGVGFLLGAAPPGRRRPRRRASGDVRRERSAEVRREPSAS